MVTTVPEEEKQILSQNSSCMSRVGIPVSHSQLQSPNWVPATSELEQRKPPVPLLEAFSCGRMLMVILKLSARG